MEDGKLKVDWQGNGLCYIALVFCSLMVLVISIWADLHSSESHWVNRSGSLLVLIGVLLEIRLFRDQASYNAEYQNALLREGIISPIQPPQLQGLFKVYRIYSHTLVIMGTLVWGYADLICC